MGLTVYKNRKFYAFVCNSDNIIHNLCFAQFHTRTYRNSFAVCDLFLIFTELINYYTFLLKNTYV